MTSVDTSQKTWSSGSHGESGPNDEDEPVTFESLGVPRTQSYSFGKRRPISSLTRVEWGFVILSVLSILGAAGLTIERLVVLKKGTADVTFAIVLLLSLVCCLFYVINGIFRERPIELLIFILGTLILIIYCIVNYAQTVDSEYKIKLARLILIVPVGFINIVVALYFAREYHKSKNYIFRTVGALVDLQNLCSRIFFTKSLFKIDLQLELTLAILVLTHGIAGANHLEIVALVVGVVYAFTWFIMGFLSISKENKILVYLLLGSSWCEPAYILYSFVRVGRIWEEFPNKLIPAGIIIAGVLGLVTRVAVCTFLVYVYRNFGRGMKEKAYGVIKKEQDSKCSKTAETTTKEEPSTQ